jgi:SAM-dependent methyltransferase
MNRYFDQLLNAYWLRPETALWRSLDINAMKNFKYISPSLDLGCGDGVFSFIRAGGELDIKFDVFLSVSNLDKYYNNIDIYDAYKKELNTVVIKKPEYLIEWGLDHKINLLNKSAQLNLFKNLKEADANKILPFKDNTFNSIFSNIIYWLNDPSAVLGDIYRVLAKGGRACFLLPNSSFKEFSFFYKLYEKNKDNNFEFLKLLDRGRISDNIKHAKNKKEWDKILSTSGFHIIENSQYLSKTVIRIWDIGLRPLFPVLYKMTSSVKSEKIIEIKYEWIEIVKKFLEPFIYLDKNLDKEEEPAFHCYIVEK